MRAVTNVIVRPSGDQEGLTSGARLRVSLRSPLPSALTTQISEPCPKPAAKMSVRPSEDQAVSSTAHQFGGSAGTRFNVSVPLPLASTTKSCCGRRVRSRRRASIRPATTPTRTTSGRFPARVRRSRRRSRSRAPPSRSGPPLERDPSAVRRPGDAPHFGTGARLVDQIEQATADPDPRCDEQSAHEDHDGRGDAPPARQSRRVDRPAATCAPRTERCRSNVSRGSGNSRGISVIPRRPSRAPSRPVLCPEPPSSSASAARARERRERMVPTGTPSATAASS